MVDYTIEENDIGGISIWLEDGTEIQPIFTKYKEWVIEINEHKSAIGNIPASKWLRFTTLPIDNHSIPK